MPRTAEIWKPIRGYTGLYEISSWGRVRSLPRTVKTSRGSRTYPGRILRLMSHSSGGFTLSLSKNSKSITVRVASLLRKAFPASHA